MIDLSAKRPSAPPLPAMEWERLEAVHASHILDSAPDPAFESIVELVRRQFQVPICVVSILDQERQWFKARCGLAADGTPRDVAFCNYTLLSSECFVVEDASRDPRFATNPLVTADPYIRFYAGAPLEVRPGLALGSLCVIGTEPRALSKEEEDVLKHFARIVTSLIDGHRLKREALALAQRSAEQVALMAAQSRDLALRDRRFQQTERMAKIGGWELDVRTEAVTWSNEIYAICGVPPGTVITLDIAAAVYPPAERSRLDMMMRRAMASEHCSFDEEFEITAMAGTRKWVRAMGEAEFVDGSPRRLFGTFQDISDRHRIQQDLWEAANRDALTGLANRHRFNEQLQRCFDGDHPHPGLLIVDADGLKDVNDTFGHEAGDALIRTLATRMVMAAGNAATVARLGGDEFAILICEAGSEAALEALATRLLQIISAPFVHGAISLKPQVSVGGALASTTSTPARLLQDADLAMYHAKETRCGYVFFRYGLRSRITARVAAISTIEAALASDTLKAWYQPSIELATGRVTGFEALARVYLGSEVHSIGRYAEALREPQVARQVTERMLASIEADALGWARAGLVIPRIAINVGFADFQSGRLEDMILSTCERAGLLPRQIALEVTETVFLSAHADVVSDTATRLRKRGVAIALDDFGTGYASLVHLATFPVDVIKIDQSFVAQLQGDGSGAVIASALIALAHELGIQVIAEGVENTEQLQRLVALRCEKVQGYFFSRPLPPEKVADFVSSFRFNVNELDRGAGRGEERQARRRGALRKPRSTASMAI